MITDIFSWIKKGLSNVTLSFVFSSKFSILFLNLLVESALLVYSSSLFTACLCYSIFFKATSVEYLKGLSSFNFFSCSRDKSLFFCYYIFGSSVCEYFEIVSSKSYFFDRFCFLPLSSLLPDVVMRSIYFGRVKSTTVFYELKSASTSSLGVLPLLNFENLRRNSAWLFSIASISLINF